MLLPDNIHPKNSIYYNASFILEVLQEYKDLEILDLFLIVRDKKDMTFSILMLCLDWLYLIDAVIVDKKGVAHLCSSNH